MGTRLAVGDIIPGVTHQITTERMIAFESVVWDRGSTAHNDPAAAAVGGMKKTFASGQNVLAFVHEMMERAFGIGWIEGGRVSMRWLRPVYADDVIATHGEVEALDSVDGHERVRVSIWAENQAGERCAAGWAEAYQKGPPGAN